MDTRLPALDRNEESINVDPMKIVGWAHSAAGQGYYRIAVPMWALGLAGHETLSIDRNTPDVPDGIDVLIGQFVVDERNEKWQEMATDPTRDFAMIFEMDDDVWSINADNGAASYYTPERLRAMERNIELADAVTVTTNRLAEVVSRFNEHVYVLPNCVDAALIFMERPTPKRLTIGWAGGSAHESDFRSVSKELRGFFQRHAAVESHLIGGNFSGLIGRPRDRYTAWRSTPEEYFREIDFDIAIAPLAHNDFNRAKSDLKFLEYAALGIPVVASDFGPYSESVQHGVTGFLATRQRDWSLYLKELVANPALRDEIGGNARRWATSRTIHGSYGNWESVYAEVLARHRGESTNAAATAALVHH